MAIILVSACLAGCSCRYKGDNCKNEKVLALAKNNILIPVCPEQLGGLSTPRSPSERVGNRVIMKTGEDVTVQYQKGAEEALYLANTFHVDYAVLKAKSPSCGHGLIYDGSFSGKLISGNGTTAELLLKNHIPVFSEEEI